MNPRLLAFSARPIAFARSPYANRIDAPHQPSVVEGTETALRVRGMDLLDGTPILDVKPCVPYADAFPDARAGWIDAIDKSLGRHSAPAPRRPRGKG